MAFIPYVTDSGQFTGSITVADTGTSTATGSNASSIYTGTPTANSFVSINALNYNSFSLQVSGTWVGTLQVENSYDNGTTWYRVVPQVRGVSNSALTITANGGFISEAAVATNVRVRALAWASGTASIVFMQSPSSEIVRVDNPIRLYDNNSSQQASIKPASTSPIATDTALVTVESPNSPLITGTIKTKLANDIPQTTGAITTASTTITTGVLSGVGSVTVQISGTYVGINVTFETSIDNTNWITVAAQVINSTTPQLVTSTGVLTANSTNIWNVSPLLGASYFRVRATAYTSGSGSVIIAPSAQFVQYAVNVSSMPNTPVTQGTASALNAQVVGSVANGSTDTGNPVKVGAVAYTSASLPVSTSASRVNMIADKTGKLVVVNSLREAKGRQVATLTSTTTETTIITATTSIYNDLYGLVISNTSATAVAVTIRDSTAGTVVTTITVPPTDVRGFMLTESAAIKQTTVNTSWTAQCGTSVASVFITALYVANL